MWSQPSRRFSQPKKGTGSSQRLWMKARRSVAHMEKQPRPKLVGVWKACPYCQGKQRCLFCGDAGGYYVARLVEVGNDDDVRSAVARGLLSSGGFRAAQIELER